MDEAPSVNTDWLVRVWFGQHIIASYKAEKTAAERYAAAMDRRFAGCKITVDPMPATIDPDRLRRMPAERLWTTDALAVL